MRGRRVERRFGWDTHGLPAELEAMSQLGIKTKEEIERARHRTSSTRPAASRCCATRQDWRDYVTRQARWVDFDNDYKTLDLTYMESVMWAFRQLYDKGLVYEGFRCLPYCWNDETPLSAHELRMDEDVYQMRQDPAVTVGLPAGDRRARADLDHHAVDAAVQPGHGGAPGRRLRRRRVGLHRPHRALRARRRPAGRLRARAGRGRRSDRPPVQGRRPGRAALHARRSATSWATPSRTSCCTPTT